MAKLLSSPLQHDSTRIVACSMVLTFAVFAYLCCINLDWALFWDDEAYIAFFARNWLKFGAPLADDGRNVFTFFGGEDLAADGTPHYPLLLPALQALSFRLFGEGESQARAISVAFSLAGMALFAQVLRHEFPWQPGFVAVAFASACLSPITIGFARSSTYNGMVLFFHMMVFWSYVRFCSSQRIGYAVLMTVSAMMAFHAHYLSSPVFVSALIACHLLFRGHCLSPRSRFILAAAGIVYSASIYIAWVYVVDYPISAHSKIFPGTLWENFTDRLRRNYNMLNTSGILPWSIAVWFVLWRLATLMFSGRGWHQDQNLASCTLRVGRESISSFRACINSLKHTKGAIHALATRIANVRPILRNIWLALRDDRVLQYLAFIIIGAFSLALMTLRMGGGEVRYFTSFAPFSSSVVAAAVCWAWRRLKFAGVALAAALLLSNIAGWPFLEDIETGDKLAWTLPRQAAEYHSDYPDSRRESIAYIRRHVRQDTLIYSNYSNPGWMLWYLSDKVLFCCGLSRSRSNNVPYLLRADERRHLFREDVYNHAGNIGGTLTPEYVWLAGYYFHVRETVRPQVAQISI